jgi:hypothetical protein
MHHPDLSRHAGHTARQRWAAVAVSALVMALPAFAQGDEASLPRGASPDATPQQRYQTAIREAGGGLKVSLEECRTLVAVERKGCESTARARYKADMDAARAMLRNPDARPVNIVGEPVRGTETTYVIRP